MEGPEFLEDKYRDLPGSKPVERAVEKKKREHETIPHDKEERIEAYIDRLDHIIEDERGWRLLKNKIIREFSIDADDEETFTKIAHDLYESEKKLAREQGRGGEIEQLEREGDVLDKYQDLIKEKKAIQEQTLEDWLSYLKENDAQYPTWFRYFVVRNLAKMGSINKERGEYTKRTKRTIAPFPELNAEALGFVYRTLTTSIPEEEFEDEPEKHARLETLVEKKDFPKLYAFAQIETAGALNRESLEGEWVKYEQGSDYHVLEEALRGKGTGWCTAEGSAYAHLEGGDFYVYYTKGPHGAYTEPRAAIRMEGDHVAEVRGVNHRQELEPELLDVAQEQYHSLPGGERFDKKTEDMKRMSEIARKHEEGESLSKDDLTFLYEINAPIEGFGYSKDPRIEEVRGERDIKEDLSFALGIPKEKISTTEEEATQGGIVFHYGQLDLSDLTTAKGLELPEHIGGTLDLRGLTNAEGLKLPESVGGSLDLRGPTTAEGLKLPESVGDGLYLDYLTTAEGLKLPEHVGGELYLGGLTTAEGLKLPESIGGVLDLGGLTTAEGLKLPESVGGTLDLRCLTTTKGLKLPESVGGSLDLRGLTTAKGLKLPESVGDGLDLGGLTTAEGLQLPGHVGGGIRLTDLPERETVALRNKYPHLADKMYR